MDDDAIRCEVETVVRSQGDPWRELLLPNGVNILAQTMGTDELRCNFSCDGIDFYSPAKYRKVIPQSGGGQSTEC